MNAETLAALADATNRMEASWDGGDLLANVEADLLFHRMIAQCCGNQMLQNLYETVRGLLGEAQRQPILRTNPNRMKASLAEHREIIAALQAGDSSVARLAMERHIRNTADCAVITI